VKTLDIKQTSLRLSVGAFVALPAFISGAAHAADITTECAANGDGSIDAASGAAGGAACSAPTAYKASLFGDGSLFQTISNTLIFLVGAVSVIMLIIGGFRYVISQGESGAVTSAKNTILYAIIGIVVAILAYAAVAYVTGTLGAKAGGGN
jgi:hypothetical protein